jgi:butyrate kinase
MQRNFLLLIINPGSTSTKIALYDNEKPVLNEVIRHSSLEISSFKSIIDQFSYRKELILKILNDNGFSIKQLSAVIGRGGLLKPLRGGTYKVNEVMLEELIKSERGQHASNLGGHFGIFYCKAIRYSSLCC